MSSVFFIELQPCHARRVGGGLARVRLCRRATAFIVSSACAYADREESRPTTSWLHRRTNRAKVPDRAAKTLSPLTRSPSRPWVRQRAVVLRQARRNVPFLRSVLLRELVQRERRRPARGRLPGVCVRWPIHSTALQLSQRFPSYHTLLGVIRDTNYDSTGVVVQMVLAFLKGIWFGF